MYGKNKSICEIVKKKKEIYASFAVTALPAPRGPKKAGFGRIRDIISVPGGPSTN